MGSSIKSIPSGDYLKDVKSILQQAKAIVYSSVNTAMVQAYWLIGKRIVLEEQNGKERADYGKKVVKTIARELTKEFGKGFSERSVWEYRQFYLAFANNERTLSAESDKQVKDKVKETDIQNFRKLRTLSAESISQYALTWSHYRLLMRLSDVDARAWYINEANENNWSVRTLDRNISTQYYHRLLASQSKEPVMEEMKERTADLQVNQLDFIKNPTVLEFLNLPNNYAYSEKQLEKALINDLQKFILELGKGFAFVERQQLVRTESSDFYIDLVFYNYILKCFVLIEIKTEKITHQDIGQLDMYVRMYDDLKRNEGDNPTIGILLCADTDQTIAKYSVLKDNEQLFASKYLSYLPTEEELTAEIERQRELFEAKQNMEELGYGE